MQKNIFNRKIKLMLTIGICVMFILLVFSGTAKKPDKSFEAFPVVRFIGSVQQNDSLTASDTWTDIPGVVLNFTLTSIKTVDFRGYGSVLIYSGHAGFRFVIDDVPYGSEQYGDLLISPSGGWVPWYMERIVELSAGEHSVKIQTLTSAGTLEIQGGDYDAARLFVQAW